MNRRACVAVLGLALRGLLGCASPVTGSGPQDPLASDTVQTPLLAWRAESGNAVAYLVGSVHVARPDIYPLDSRLEAAFERSGALVLEIAASDAERAQMARRMLAAGRASPSRQLPDMVSAQTLELLEGAAKARGYAVEPLLAMQPWFVAISLTTQELSREGFVPQWGIDEHFRRKAQGSKRIIGLETVQEQLDLLSGLEEDTQEVLLRWTLIELEQAGSQLEQAFVLWKRGDASGLDRLMLEPLRGQHPDLFARVFLYRNHRMAETVVGLLDQGGTYFVVVGAGHLIGRSGVVDLLARRGIVPQQL